MHEDPDCVTVNVCPPAVIVPVLEVALGFAVTAKLIVPLPFPLLFVVSQAELLVALQLHSAAAATMFTLLVLPDKAIVWLGEDNEYVHATPAWFTM